MSSRMRSKWAAAAVAAVLMTGGTFLAGCGDDDGAAAPTATPVAQPTSTPAPTASPAQTPTVSPTPTDTPAPIQPAIWPASNVVFASPEEAATDFVEQALHVPAVLGPFQQGDSRSGEIEVFLQTEGSSTTPLARSLLLLRQLGPDDGWFVIGAANDNASISTPATLDEVPVGVVTVEGLGRGFEATVIVEAFIAGQTTLLDQVVTFGGSYETPEPFTVEIDLSSTSPGDVVVLLVRGGVGLETDPGDFGAIPVVMT